MQLLPEKVNDFRDGLPLLYPLKVVGASKAKNQA